MRIEAADLHEEDRAVEPEGLALRDNACDVPEAVAEARHREVLSEPVVRVEDVRHVLGVRQRGAQQRPVPASGHVVVGASSRCNVISTRVGYVSAKIEELSLSTRALTSSLSSLFRCSNSSTRFLSSSCRSSLLISCVSSSLISSFSSSFSALRAMERRVPSGQIGSVGFAVRGSSDLSQNGYGTKLFCFLNTWTSGTEEIPQG